MNVQSRLTRGGRSTGRLVVIAMAATLVLTACGRGEQGDKNEGDIVVGASLPMSGPLAAFSAYNDGMTARFAAVNEEGGVDGRKIDYQVLDDAAEPARAVSNARKLIDGENASVVVTFGAPAFAVAPIAASSDVAQVALTGGSPVADLEAAPHTRGLFSANQLDMTASLRSVLAENPSARLGSIMLNNEGRKDFEKAIDEVLKEFPDASWEKQVLYEQTEPTLTGPVNQLRDADVDTIVLFATGSALIEGVKYVDQIGFDATVVIQESVTGIGPTMSQMGAAAEGVRTSRFSKDPADPQWAGDDAIADYTANLEKYAPGADPTNDLVLKGYAAAELIIKVLESADSSSAEDFLKAWDSLEDGDLDILLPDVPFGGESGDGRIVNTVQPVVFTDGSWQAVGDPEMQP